MRKIFREATVFVNPSFFENCSISILEAMSSGCAVVASNVGGNPELIQSGKEGLLVRAFDDKAFAGAIISLLKDESFTSSIGKEARRKVERYFTSIKCAEDTFDIYKQILSKSY